MTDPTTIDLSEKANEEKITIEEMNPVERAKFSLAKWVLLAGALLMLVSWIINLWSSSLSQPILEQCLDLDKESAELIGENCKNLIEQSANFHKSANNIFEFAKSWIPPVITLVLGYYFAKEKDTNDSSE